MPTAATGRAARCKRGRYAVRGALRSSSVGRALPDTGEHRVWVRRAEPDLPAFCVRTGLCAGVGSERFEESKGHRAYGACTYWLIVNFGDP